MNRILFLLLDAAIAAVLLSPAFLLLSKRYFTTRSSAFFRFLFSVYLCSVYAVVGLPNVTYFRFDPHFNFVPFAYMFSDYKNSLLNVLLFLPMGFSLPVFWKRYKPLGRTLLFGFCLSALIELMQIFTFRATDVNDLMTNTLGTLLGWWIGRLFLRLAPSISSSWKGREVWLLCGLSFGVMFFLYPFVYHWIFLLFP